MNEGSWAFQCDANTFTSEHQIFCILLNTDGFNLQPPASGTARDSSSATTLNFLADELHLLPSLGAHTIPFVLSIPESALSTSYYPGRSEIFLYQIINAWTAYYAASSSKLFICFLLSNNVHDPQVRTPLQYASKHRGVQALRGNIDGSQKIFRSGSFGEKRFIPTVTQVDQPPLQIQLPFWEHLTLRLNFTRLALACSI
jgi:hypothetical protein